MAEVIWKYILEIRDVQTLLIPRKAEGLSVQIQRGHICLWVKVNPNAPTEERTFIIRGTGHPLPEGKLSHIGSVQQHDFVWHVFEVL